jgi:hypothetical protein
MPGTVLQFDPSCSNRQKEWFQEAMLRSHFPFDRADLKLSVKGVDEPPCPGHNDYMCTETYHGGPEGTFSIIYIRNGVEDPNHPANAGVPTIEGRKLFWLESAIHEVGHAFTLGHLAVDDPSTAHLCEMFQYRDSPGTPRYGTLPDWSVGADTSTSLDPWRNAISEAVAEWFKDLYLPAQYRWYSQRTLWDFRRESFTSWWDLLEAFMCPAPSDSS